MSLKKLFCFIPHYCLQCNEEIHLDTKRLGRYEQRGYPQYHSGHKKKNFRKEQGDFCFIPSLCLCGCGNNVKLYRERIRMYELHGYPQYNLGHKSRILNPNEQLIFGDFCYTIKCFCSCPCHQEIQLSKKQILGYEHNGYPKYIVGHVFKDYHPRSITQGDFSFIPYKCKCGCNDFIELNKENIARHEKEGYPEYKKGHNARCTTEQQRENMSKAQIIANSEPERKKKQIERMKGNEYYRGHKHTEQWKYNMRGHRHPRWNGGVIGKHRRRKQLGWYSLNPIIGNGRKMIKGYERHHVNHNDIIYVPRYYNQDIVHNLSTGYNMTIVNTIAYFFLLMNYIENLNKLFTN